MVDDLESAASQLRAFEGKHHDPRDVTEVLVIAGSRLELFFKDALFPDATKKDGADAVINRLKSLGVEKSVRDDLHAAREKCNDAKHDARFGISIERAARILEDASGAVETLINLDIDGISKPRLVGELRVYWIAAWDHFIHGDTEIHITLPTMNKGWAPQFDTYNIDISSWDSLKAELGNSLHLGRGTVDDAFYESCACESDFLNAGVYQGEYRVLSTALAKRLVNEDKLLTGLRRQDDYNGVVAAGCMAAVDAAQANPEIFDAAQFENQLLDVAEQQYAVARDASLIKALAPLLSKLILDFEETQRAKITGPLWVDEMGFARYSSRGGVADDRWKIGLDPHGVLFAVLRAN